MKALYFRHLFQNTKRGTAHTVSVSGEEGEFFLYSMISNGQPLRDEEHEEEKFQVSGKTLSVLVLENLHTKDLDKAKEILRSNRVKQVFVPYGDSAANLQELSLADKVCILKAEEKVSFRKTGWNVWIKCVENGEKGNLILYHGPSDEIKEGKDCLMAVKPAERDLHCSMCMDQDDHACGMRCCLYNDFTVCKGHNGKNADHYVTGTLLLGNIDLKTKEKELKEDLKEYVSDIRMVCLGEAGGAEKFSDSFLEYLDRENKHLNQYYILPEDEDQNEGTLKTILKKGCRRIPVLTGENTGLCLSGFLKNKENM